MIVEACERLLEAHAHVGRCADLAWAPRGEADSYRLANQELWIREWRFQEQYHSLSPNLGDCSPAYPVRTVHDTIPGSRLARIYAVGRQYDPEREACYTPAYDIGHDTSTTHPVNIGPPYENIECWQMPEVEMYFRELTKGHPEQDLFFSALVDSSVSEIPVEDQCKTVNMRDKDWICQTPWRTILSERYPPMKDLLDKTDSQRCNGVPLDMASYPTPRYSATSLQELALQMKLHSSEIRAIWNDNNVQCPKRQRRTLRLPMEPSTLVNNKRFPNTDVVEFYPTSNSIETASTGYSLFQENHSSVHENIRQISRDDVDFEEPRFNVFNEIDSRKSFFFNKNTEIIDKSSTSVSESNKEKNEESTVNSLSANESLNKKPGCQSSEKIFKILHSPQNISLKVPNYVRNVPANVSPEYSPSAIQGIEFNPIFTPENRPNIEDKFSRTPGAGRQFTKKRKKQQNLVDTFSKPDHKAVKLLDALTKISQSVENLSECHEGSKSHLESSSSIHLSETVDSKASKTCLSTENDSTAIDVSTRSTTYPLTKNVSLSSVETKSKTAGWNGEALSENFSNIRTNTGSNDAGESKQEQNSGVHYTTHITDDGSPSEDKYKYLRVEFALSPKKSYPTKKIHIGSVDVPEFIPRFQAKDNFGINLKVASSLPNISETSEIPEFYPKDYHNIPKKAASVYDKPLKNTKVILPENTSNSISSDSPMKFQNNERPIPVYQRPREFYNNTTNYNLTNIRQRKQQGVDYNNLILLTSNGKDTRKWINKEYPSRTIEFDKIDNLINRFGSIDNESELENETQQIPDNCEKYYTKTDSRMYQNVPQPNPFSGLVNPQPTLSRLFPIQNVGIPVQNVINILPGGVLVSSNSQVHNILPRNIYTGQHLTTFPLHNTTNRPPGVQVSSKISVSQSSSPRTLLATSRAPLPFQHSVQLPPAFHTVSSAHLPTVTCTPTMVSVGSDLSSVQMPSAFTHMRNSSQNISSKMQQVCHSKMIVQSNVKNPVQTSSSVVLNPSQGAKRRLYSAVLSNTNTTMDSEYDELERQALEQYRPSDESLKGSSDDSIQAKYQELERLAMEQYTTSSSSGSSESCTLGNGTIMIDGQMTVRTNSETNTLKHVPSVQRKGAVIRKSSSNLSMGSKKSTVLLPSIGEVSNDEADSPKGVKLCHPDDVQFSKRKLIVVKPSPRPVLSDHSSDGEENDACGPQIITNFPGTRKTKKSSLGPPDRSEIEFKASSLMVSIDNSPLSDCLQLKPDSCFDTNAKKEYSKDIRIKDFDGRGTSQNTTCNEKQENDSTLPLASSYYSDTYFSKESKSLSRNKRRQGRKAKKVNSQNTEEKFKLYEHEVAPVEGCSRNLEEGGIDVIAINYLDNGCQQIGQVENLEVEPYANGNNVVNEHSIKKNYKSLCRDYGKLLRRIESVKIDFNCDQWDRLRKRVYVLLERAKICEIQLTDWLQTTQNQNNTFDYFGRKINLPESLENIQHIKFHINELIQDWGKRQQYCTTEISHMESFTRMDSLLCGLIDQVNDHEKTAKLRDFQKQLQMFQDGLEAKDVVNFSEFANNLDRFQTEIEKLRQDYNCETPRNVGESVENIASTSSQSRKINCGDSSLKLYRCDNTEKCTPEHLALRKTDFNSKFKSKIAQIVGEKPLLKNVSITSKNRINLDNNVKLINFSPYEVPCSVNGSCLNHSENVLSGIFKKCMKNYECVVLDTNFFWKKCKITDVGNKYGFLCPSYSDNVPLPLFILKRFDVTYAYLFETISNQVLDLRGIFKWKTNLENLVPRKPNDTNNVFSEKIICVVCYMKQKVSTCMKANNPELVRSVLPEYNVQFYNLVTFNINLHSIIGVLEVEIITRAFVFFWKCFIKEYNFDNSDVNLASSSSSSRIKLITLSNHRSDCDKRLHVTMCKSNDVTAASQENFCESAYFPFTFLPSAFANNICNTDWKEIKHLIVASNDRDIKSSAEIIPDCCKFCTEKNTDIYVVYIRFYNDRQKDSFVFVSRIETKCFLQLTGRYRFVRLSQVWIVNDAMLESKENSRNELKQPYKFMDENIFLKKIKKTSKHLSCLLQ